MIKIKKNLDKLRDTVKIIENINSEIDFVFCQEGIIVKAIDPPAISIGIFRIKKDMFEEYDIEEEKICKFQVNLLTKILRKAGKKELQITLKEDKVNFKTSKDEFSLKFFVGQDEDRPEPDFEGESKWTINTKEFFTLVKDFADFNEVIKIDSNDGNLYLGTKSTLLEGKSVTDSIPHGAIDCKCWYSLPNFTMISNIQKIFDSVEFEFSGDRPCMINAEDDNLKFKWVLAPRTEE